MNVFQVSLRMKQSNCIYSIQSLNHKTFIFDVDASNEVREGEKAPIQFRSRVVLKNPTNGGEACLHLEELRPCPLSAARCRHYQWQLTNWSECQLPEKCGEGFRTRGEWNGHLS